MKYFFATVATLCATAFIATSCADDESLDTPYEPSVIVLNANASQSASTYGSVEGVAADGVSQLEFAIPYNSDNEVVSVIITEPSEAWGTLETTLSEPTVKNSLNAYRFTLTSSENLPAALSTTSKATLSYTFDITTADGEVKSVTSSIVVVRPPALFVHGLGSEASTFDTMFDFITPKGLFIPEALSAADYSGTALDSYDTNKDVVPNGINALRSSMAGAGIVCERVTVAGHSMGGILTRIYMQGRSSVAYRDDIHKVITINTPHSGSQLADFAVALGSANPDGVIEVIASKGAIVDLAVESTATATLNSASNLLAENNLDIPTHLVTSHIGTLSDIAELVQEGNTMAAIASYAIDKIEADLFYNGDTSDIVVPTTSQKGGVSNGLLNNYIEDFSNEWHCSILTAESVATHIIDVLDAATTSNYFTTNGFSPATLTYDSSLID